MPPMKRNRRVEKRRDEFVYANAERIGLEKLEKDMKMFAKKIRDIINDYAVAELGVNFVERDVFYFWSSHGQDRRKFLVLIVQEVFRWINDCTCHADLAYFSDTVKEELEYMFSNISEFILKPSPSSGEYTLQFSASVKGL